MLLIRPFRGIVYNKEKIGDLSRVVAPPYDVISPEEQNFYYQLHRFNIIRIILGKEQKGDNSRENKYTRAARFFREWLSSGILKKEDVPSIYIYGQEYTVEGEKFKRKGFIALMRLEEFGTGTVFPHEHIFPEPQQDRLSLMLNCRANLSAIFSFFADPSCEIDRLMEKSRLIYEFEDVEGIKHILSAIRDQKMVNLICQIMQDKKIFIADGHHRYFTALKLRDRLKKNSSSYVMMYFLNTESSPVTILPVHRLIGGLRSDEFHKLIEGVKRFFYLEHLGRASEKKTEDDLKRRMLFKVKSTKNTIFGMYCREEGYSLLIPKDEVSFPKKVNSAILDDLVRGILGKNELEKGREIDFTTDVNLAIDKVREGKFQIAFFLAPVSVEQIKNVALAGEKMPPKSTYFYPKLISGLVMRDLEDAV